MTVSGQLESGVRYLDLRVHRSSDGVHNPPSPAAPKGPAAPTGDSIPRALPIAIALLAIAMGSIMRFASKRSKGA